MTYSRAVACARICASTQASAVMLNTRRTVAAGVSTRPPETISDDRPNASQGYLRSIRDSFGLREKTHGALIFYPVIA